jgi:hypothetical protein
MKTQQEFRKRSAECERLAETSDDPATSEMLLSVAAGWRLIAQEDEAAARQKQPPSAHSPTKLYLVK